MSTKKRSLRDQLDTLTTLGKKDDELHFNSIVHAHGLHGVLYDLSVPSYRQLHSLAATLIANAMVQSPVPKPAPGSYNSIAAQYARAKAANGSADKKKVDGLLNDNGILNPIGKPKNVAERLNEFKAGRFTKDWAWIVGVFVWML